MWNIFLIDLSSLLRTETSSDHVKTTFWSNLVNYYSLCKISYMEHNFLQIVFYQRKPTKEDNIFP